MPCVKSTAAGFAVGRGGRDGAGAMKEGTSMDESFVLQWYWQESSLCPYERTKAYYHGPREKWMKLVKEKKK